MPPQSLPLPNMYGSLPLHSSFHRFTAPMTKVFLSLCILLLSLSGELNARPFQGAHDYSAGVTTQITKRGGFDNGAERTASFDASTSSAGNKQVIKMLPTEVTEEEEEDEHASSVFRYLDALFIAQTFHPQERLSFVDDLPTIFSSRRYLRLQVFRI